MPVTAPVQGTYCHGGYPYAGVAGVGYGGGFALIVVLFILLIIIGAVCWTW
ncbi:MAG TPA: sporulation protein YjcZ [Bacillus bacterium]|nr:sporulation protein YjcZ [Bacillus sp. (in: firmicutes)]